MTRYNHQSNYMSYCLVPVFALINHFNRVHQRAELENADCAKNKTNCSIISSVSMPMQQYFLAIIYAWYASYSHPFRNSKNVH